MRKHKTQPKKIIYPSYDRWATRQAKKSKIFREASRMEYWRLKVAIAIVETRKRKKLSQDQLSKLTGIPRPIIARTESGKQNLTLDTITRLSSALGLELKLEETKK